MRPAAEAGFIYDIGYRRYEGPRLGRGYAFRSLFVHSLRQAWGLHRGGRSLVVPFGVFLLILFPALLQVLLQGMSGGQAKLLGYADYFEYVQGMVVFFCAAQAPELVSTDQHSRVLPLYFSRALRRADYAAAKLLAMVAAIWILVLTPMVLLFVGHLSAASDIGVALRGERAFALPVLASTLLVAAVMGSISVALASVTPRRGLASALIFGVVIVTSAVASILLAETEGAHRRFAALISPLRVLENVIQWLFDVPVPAAMKGQILPAGASLAAALLLVALATATLFTRYARVRA